MTRDGPITSACKVGERIACSRFSTAGACSRSKRRRFGRLQMIRRNAGGGWVFVFFFICLQSCKTASFRRLHDCRQTCDCRQSGRVKQQVCTQVCRLVVETCTCEPKEACTMNETSWSVLLWRVRQLAQMQVKTGPEILNI